jgi:hypothetical protein
MHELYDVGYQELRDIELLHKVVKELGALLIDIRFSPRSRDAQWNKSALEKRFGGSYLHLKELGNKHYHGGEIEFVDLDAGIDLVTKELEKRPVLLMCACWQRNSCHRFSVVKTFETRFNVASIWLTTSQAKEIAGRSQPKQLDLFGV